MPMAMTTPSKAAPERSPSRERADRGAPPRRALAAHVPAPTSIAARSGARTLFAVPFANAMSDADIAILARALDLVTHMHPKLHHSPTSPGLVRLDLYSGLFLERGPAEGHWVLEGRTWGHPSPSIAHDWHLRAAAAARRLDPTVAVPERLTPAVATAL